MSPRRYERRPNGTREGPWRPATDRAARVSDGVRGVVHHPVQHQGRDRAMRHSSTRDQWRDGRRTVASRRRWRLRPTLLVLEDRRMLSTIVVNNPTDTPVTGQIDLRQAIALANANGGADTIVFDSKVF